MSKKKCIYNCNSDEKTNKTLSEKNEHDSSIYYPEADEKFILPEDEEKPELGYKTNDK